MFLASWFPMKKQELKAITQLHRRKTQHHVHNYLNLNSCCGRKWCTSTYTSTFNNNIWDVLHRVEHVLHNWTFFSWFLVNSPKKVDTTCQAFSLIHFRSRPRQWWALNLHWVNIYRGLTLGVNKFFAISGVPRPFGAFLWYFTTWGLRIFPVATVPSNMISMEPTFGKSLWQMVDALGYVYMCTTNNYDTI